MRKHIILLYLIILSASCFAQTVTKTVGIVYTAGAPAHAPAAKVGSQVAIDTATWEWYEYNGSAWIASGDRIQSISGCSAPNYTPTKYQSRLVINACTAGQGGPELYYYTGGSWLQINEGQTYTAGGGISIAGGQISASDISPTNEIQTLSIAGSNLSISSGNTVSLPTGLTSLNGLTGGAQTFSTGTSGTDFSISSTTNTHTFNLPSASAANRGALTSADWSVFNSKIAGSGTSGYLSKWSGGSVLSASGVYDNSGAIGIGTATTSGRLRVVDNGASGNYVIEVHTDDQIPWVAAFFNDTYSSSIPGLEYFIFNNGSFAMGTGAAGKAFSIYQGYGNNRLTIQADGNFYFQKNIGALTSNPSSAVDITGATGYTQLRIRTSYTPTGSADALGSTGDTAWDANYFYIKTAAGWKRAALSTF